MLAQVRTQVLRLASLPLHSDDTLPYKAYFSEAVGATEENAILHRKVNGIRFGELSVR